MSGKLKNQRGVTIFLALLITTIFLAMGLGLTAILKSQKETIRRIDYSANALSAADTGIEQMLYEDRIFPKMDGDSIIGSLSGTNASYKAIIYRNCGGKVVTSAGLYKGVKRTLRVSFKEPIGIRIEENMSTGNTCAQYCASLLPALTCCASIGTDADALNGKYYDTAGCALVSGDCDTPMFNTGHNCGGATTRWTNCRCYP